MAEDSFNQKAWPEEKSGQNQPPSIGTGEGEVPLAKPPGAPKEPKVDVRTSTSDIKSMQESGGGPPRPYTPPPPPTGGEGGQQIPPAAPEKKQSFSQVFKPPQVEQSPTPAKLPESSGGMQVGAEKSKKGLFLGILALIIVVGLVAAGYFFVYPFFFQAEEVVEVPQESVSPPSAEVPTIPEVPAIPEVPEVPLEGEQVEEEAEVMEEISLTPTITEHTSSFKTPADLSEDVDLFALDLGSVRSSIQFTTAEVPIFKELVLKDSEGNFVSFSGLMDALLPAVFSGEVIGVFEPDFTMFAYTDDKGTWPGYVARLRSGAVLSDAEGGVSQLENDTNITNLFLIDPGSSTTWEGGQTEGVSNRYLTFSQSGAGLNYGWLNNDTLVIGTSYSGFQEALKHLK
ncbi:MAG: hypothetical protein KJI72_02410 [Patescibacteria group bacterium]|nr:hypothetical protein [Patescibacteria group bacterium]